LVYIIQLKEIVMVFWLSWLDNISECSSSFPPCHWWPAEVARTTKPNVQSSAKKCSWGNHVFQRVVQSEFNIFLPLKSDDYW